MSSVIASPAADLPDDKPEGHDQPAPAIGPESIDVTQLEPLVVPSVDIGVDVMGDDVDFSAQMAMMIRRPALYEWFHLFPALGMSTTLLPIRSGPNGLETRWCYPDKAVWAHPRVRAGMVPVRVTPWFSDRDRLWNLWIVAVNGSTWFRTLQPIFTQAQGTYASMLFTIAADRQASRYRIWIKAAERTAPQLPSRPIGALLGEALGSEGHLRSLDHPLLKGLVDGQAL